MAREEEKKPTTDEHIRTFHANGRRAAIAMKIEYDAIGK